MQKKGQLYLIPTPLAENSLDKTIVALLRTVVKELDYYLVEDVRTARRFISSLNTGVVIEDLKFFELTKKTSRLDAERFLNPLKEGKDIGIMSEAGCPGVADPGALAASIAHQWGVKVVPLVGPSSILLALMASGFNGQQFTFHGYLPIKTPELVKRIKSLDDESLNKRQTQIFIEAPYRNNNLLKTLLKSCRPQTKLCVARDLTGENEMIISKSISEWRNIKMELHKIPAIFLLLSE